MVQVRAKALPNDGQSAGLVARDLLSTFNMYLQHLNKSAKHENRLT